MTAAHSSESIEPDDGAFSVIVPALPEAHTWGETPEHAIEMAREVIQLCLDERRARGEDIPPSDAGATLVATVRIPAA
ncbi:MAG TPA: type II toxin-antitoxin system HicB family antitoxin [Candidatus Baltobacteraceae bacterium]|nr:type II toxin-antitoxin system HicB family antitoxin [Candidatus Baltobacteraceae bacterium]